MRRYLIHFFLVAITLGGALAGFNFLVDPYWIFGAPEINRFNIIKPEVSSNQRISEVTRVLDLAPAVLILGSSREDHSIDPRHPAFMGKSAFNAAIPSQPYAETRRILDMLVEADKVPKIVVAGLIFEYANTQLKPPADYSEENFRDGQRWRLLGSLHTFLDSLGSVAVNLSNSDIKQLDQPVWRKDGFRYYGDYQLRKKKSQRRFFLENEEAYMRFYNRPEPYCGFDMVDPQSGRSSMDELRQFMATIYRKDMEAHLFIGPSHARQWETIAVSGLWDRFEEWKRQLVRMNEEEAAKAGKQPVPLWDFSGYNSITTEDVPFADNADTRMTYYLESSHFTPVVGDRILDRMLDYRTPEREVPDDFGVRITSANLDAHLADIRAERERYRLTHPNDVAEIEALEQKVKKTKRCIRPADRGRDHFK